MKHTKFAGWTHFGWKILNPHVFSRDVELDSFWRLLPWCRSSPSFNGLYLHLSAFRRHGNTNKRCATDHYRFPMLVKNILSIRRTWEPRKGYGTPLIQHRHFISVLLLRSIHLLSPTLFVFFLLCNICCHCENHSRHAFSTMRRNSALLEFFVFG